eukprot:TRINITY_DN4219_c0_g1_i1.p1 TRINITY_DN4219_c0_g1~~TRINITY_DN4219_c0_g1_i1.p1  ORF type:complete len:1045 (-),score=277.12 TRINITY_DN4219_c0_g1_i1:22-3108(-)
MSLPNNAFDDPELFAAIQASLGQNLSNQNNNLSGTAAAAAASSQIGPVNRPDAGQDTQATTAAASMYGEDLDLQRAIEESHPNKYISNEMSLPNNAFDDPELFAAIQASLGQNLSNQNNNLSGTAAAAAASSQIGPVNRPDAGQDTQATTAAASMYGEDLDLQRAIEESQRSSGVAPGNQNEDEVLQRVLLESMNTSNVNMGGSSTGGDVNNDQSEIEIQKAIEASIMSSTVPVGRNDPSGYTREEGMPIGLRNVGNTCYVNSLLQTYFMLPPLRHFILSSGYYKFEEGDNDSIKQAKKFMNELQYLFATMMYSEKRFTDPTDLLHSIVDEKGNTIKIGSQEDVGEFMDIFHDWLDKCVSRLEPDHQGRSTIEEMFFIEAVSILSAKELDGEDIVQTTDETFSFLMVDVNENNFHNSLESRLSTTMEWTTPQGHTTIGKQETWLKKLPPVLMFREQRIEYVPGTGAFKTNRALEFSKELDMERYLERNRDVAEGKRTVSADLREQLALVQEKINKRTNYKDLGTSLSTILEGSLLYLEEESIDETLYNMMKDIKLREEEEMERLHQEAEEIKEAIRNEYSDLTGSPYTLVGLWLHSGSTPGSGHYWAYIRDPETDEWYKYNDQDVSPVSETKVWEDAVGGPDSGVSAYFLIYLSVDQLDQFSSINYHELVSDEVMEYVERNNLIFREELREYELSQLTGTEEFIARFLKRVEETENLSQLSGYCRDFRFRDVPTYLNSFGRTMESKAWIYMELWDQLYKSSQAPPSRHEIKRDLLMKPMCISISEDEISQIQQKVDQFRESSTTKERYLEDCKKYNKLMNAYLIGLRLAKERNFRESVEYIHQAHAIKLEIEEGTVRLDIETVLLVLSQEIFNLAMETKQRDHLSDLKKTIPVLFSLSNEEKIIRNREIFFQIYTENIEVLVEVQDLLQDIITYIIDDDRDYDMPGKNHFQTDLNIHLTEREDIFTFSKQFYVNYSSLLREYKDDILQNAKLDIFPSIYTEMDSITEDQDFSPSASIIAHEPKNSSPN